MHMTLISLILPAVTLATFTSINSGRLTTLICSKDSANDLHRPAMQTLTWEWFEKSVDRMLHSPYTEQIQLLELHSDKLNPSFVSSLYSLSKKQQSRSFTISHVTLRSKMLHHPLWYMETASATENWSPPLLGWCRYTNRGWSDSRDA